MNAKLLLIVVVLSSGGCGTVNRFTAVNRSTPVSEWPRAPFEGLTMGENVVVFAYSASR